MSPIVQAAAAWLLAYAVHSTLLLGAAALLTRWAVRDPAWRETLWKAALVGAVVTVSVQTLVDFRPAVGRWSVTIAPVPAEPAQAEWKATDAATQADPTLREPIAATRASMTPPAASTGSAATAATTPAAASASPSAPASVPAAPSTPAGRTSSTEPAASWQTDKPGIAWGAILLLAWAAGAALLLARVAWRQAALQRLLNDRRPVEDPALLALMDELRRKAGLAAAVRLTRSDRCATPMALAMDEVCVPGRFVAELKPDEQRGALAHELAHLARRDPLWHLAAGVAEALFFFQPLNRLARRRLRESAEYLADDWAVRQTGSPIGLARCLVEVAAWVSASPAPVPEGALAMAEGEPTSLARRVERLVARADLPALPRIGLRAAAAAALLAAVALVAPAVAPLAAEASLAVASGGWDDQDRKPGASQQEPVVVRHPDPAQPLAARWEWAAEQARRGGQRGYWVGWSITPVPLRGNGHIEDSHGVNIDEFSGRSLPQLLGASERDAIILLRMTPGGRIERVSTRVGRLGMALGGVPVYWLGAARTGESLDWLMARERSEDDLEIRGVMLETIALHPVSDRVVPLLLDRLRAGDTRLREAAAEGLGHHPRPDALRALVAASEEDRSEDVRNEAVEAVGEMRTPEALTALRGILRGSRHVDVRREAAETLGEQEGPGIAAELEQVALSDPAEEVRVEATEALAEQPAERALPVLSRLARTHPSEEVRVEAVETLGELPALAGLPALDEIAARDGDPEAQREAVETIADLPPEVSRPRILRFATGATNAEVRREAVEALGDSKSPEALNDLERIAMNDRDPDVQREAVEAMGAQPHERAVPVLARMAWRSPSVDARREAAETLGEAKTDAALAALDSIVARHPDEDVQREAVEALGEIPARLSRSRLERIRDTHPNPNVRREAAETLSDLASR
ncbi:MAG TPA: M56 family metallopeptidase [Longimicrobium sp.]|nr:M56 family metallopeptidase [Longimicrobium sp.]